MTRKAFVLIIFSVFCFSALNLCLAESSAPDFKLQALDNNTVSLSGYRNYKSVLILFWTTWCPYCRDQLAEMNKNYMKLTSGGVEILAINVGESANKAGKFAKAHKLGYKVLLDRDSRVANSYDVIGVPTYILVNKEGEIAFTGNSYPHKEIDKLISE